MLQVVLMQQVVHSTGQVQASIATKALEIQKVPASIASARSN